MSCDTYDLSFGTFFARKEKTTRVTVGIFESERSVNEEEMKDHLFEKKLKPLLEITSKNVELKKPIEKGIVKIVNVGSKIRAEVVCVFCDKRKKGLLTIQCDSHANSKVHYWNISNFKKHLESHQKTASKLKALEDAEKCDAIKSEDVEASENGTEAKSQVFMFDVNSNIHSEQMTIENENLHNKLFEQLSKQNLQNIVNRMKMNENVAKMNFKIGSENHTVDIVKIAPNGAFFFGAVAHQIYGLKVDSKEHKQKTTELRAEVVSHIQSNYENFELALKGRVYEGKTERVDAANLKSECLIFLNACLTRSTCYAGYESVRAIYELKKINIITISENGD